MLVHLDAGAAVNIKRETEGSLRSSSLKASSTDSAATKTGIIDWASIKVGFFPSDVTSDSSAWTRPGLRRVSDFKRSHMRPTRCRTAGRCSDFHRRSLTHTVHAAECMSADVCRHGILLDIMTCGGQARAAAAEKPVEEALPKLDSFQEGGAAQDDGDADSSGCGPAARQQRRQELSVLIPAASMGCMVVALQHGEGQTQGCETSL